MKLRNPDHEARVRHVCPDYLTLTEWTCHNRGRSPRTWFTHPQRASHHCPYCGDDIVVEAD